QAAGRVDRDLGADETGFEGGVEGFEGLDGFDVRGKGRCRGVQYGEIVIARAVGNLRKLQAVRRRVDQFAVPDQSRRLRQPGRIPERAEFAACPKPRAGATVETLKRGRLQKQCAHHDSASPWRASVLSALTP